MEEAKVKKPRKVPDGKLELPPIAIRADPPVTSIPDPKNRKWNDFVYYGCGLVERLLTFGTCGSLDAIEHNKRTNSRPASCCAPSELCKP